MQNAPVQVGATTTADFTLEVGLSCELLIEWPLRFDWCRCKKMDGGCAWANDYRVRPGNDLHQKHTVGVVALLATTILYVVILISVLRDLHFANK
jgi:hypothetical protein